MQLKFDFKLLYFYIFWIIFYIFSLVLITVTGFLRKDSFEQNSNNFLFQIISHFIFGTIFYFSVIQNFIFLILSFIVPKFRNRFASFNLYYWTLVCTVLTAICGFISLFLFLSSIGYSHARMGNMTTPEMDLRYQTYWICENICRVLSIICPLVVCFLILKSNKILQKL